MNKPQYFVHAFIIWCVICSVLKAEYAGQAAVYTTNDYQHLAHSTLTQMWNTDIPVDPNTHPKPAEMVLFSMTGIISDILKRM